MSAHVQIFNNGLNDSTKALVDTVCGGSITMKTAREANVMFEELAKNNYQPPFERGDGRKQGGIHEVDRMSSLEAKFEALMTKLNQQVNLPLGKLHTCKHKVLLWKILHFILKMKIM